MEVISMKITHTKKNPLSLWMVVDDSGDVIKLMAVDDNYEPLGETKEIKRITYKRSYRTIEVPDSDVYSGTVAAANDAPTDTGEPQRDISLAQEESAEPKIAEDTQEPEETPRKPKEISEDSYVYMDKRTGKVYVASEEVTERHIGFEKVVRLTNNLDDVKDRVTDMPHHFYVEKPMDENNQPVTAPKLVSGVDGEWLRGDILPFPIEPAKAAPPAPPAPSPAPAKTGSNKSSMREDRDSKLDAAKPYTPIKKGNYNLRQSMITSYLQCPTKFYKTYEEGLREDSIFTKMGTAVHGVLEDYYMNVKQAKESAGFAVDNVLMHQSEFDALFDKWWEKHGISDQKQYQTCHRIILDYIDRDKNPNVMFLEYEFETEINDIPLTGTIDRIDRIDDDTIAIIDYKTNMLPFSKSEVDESIQFQQYVMALNTPKLRSEIGEFKHVVCRYEMLRLGYAQEVEFRDVAENEQIKEFTRWVTMLYKKIMNGSDRQPTTNKYCSFCSIRGECSAYNSMIKNIPADINGDNVESLIKAMDMLNDAKKATKNEYDNVQVLVKGHMVNNDGAVGVDGREYYMTAMKRDAYNTQDIIRILAMNGLTERFAEVFNVNIQNLNKLVKEQPHIAAQVERVRKENYQAPQIKNRRKK